MAAPELDVAMRKRLQTFVHIYDFLTDTVWEDLLNAGASTEGQNIVFGHSLS